LGDKNGYSHSTEPFNWQRLNHNIISPKSSRLKQIFRII